MTNVPPLPSRGSSLGSDDNGAAEQLTAGAGSSTDPPKGLQSVSKAAAMPKGNVISQGSVMMKQMPHSHEVLGNLKRRSGKSAEIEGDRPVAKLSQKEVRGAPKTFTRLRTNRGSGQGHRSRSPTRTMQATRRHHPPRRRGHDYSASDSGSIGDPAERLHPCGNPDCSNPGEYSHTCYRQDCRASKRRRIYCPDCIEGPCFGGCTYRICEDRLVLLTDAESPINDDGPESIQASSDEERKRKNFLTSPLSASECTQPSPIVQPTTEVLDGHHETQKGATSKDNVEDNE